MSEASVSERRTGFVAFVKERLVFKAYEIEELADRWFFRPAGAVVAYAAYQTPLTPNQLTVISAAIGVASGLQLYWPGRAWWAFAGLVLHSVCDSADGQLARLKKMISVEGRILDGLSGYATFTTIYIAIGLGHCASGGSRLIFVPVALAGISHMFQASMYDYYRNQYIDYAIKARVPAIEKPDSSTKLGRMVSFLYGDYDFMQRMLAPFHVRLEKALRGLFPGGRLSPEAAESYRRRNFWMVRCWNLFGDNTRFYAVAACAWFGRNDLFLYLSLLVLNAAFIVFAPLQAAQDRRLIDDLGAA